MSIRSQNIYGLIISFFIGILIVFNQFGGYLGKKYDIAFLSRTWEINGLTRMLDLKAVIVLSAILLALHHLTFKDKSVIKASFSRGLFTGFLFFPFVVCAGGLIFAALWFIGKILIVIGYIITYIAVPITWLWAHLIEPILKFIAIPFIWLWKTLIYPILSFVTGPFAWLWKSVVLPILIFLKPLFKLLLILAAVILFGLLALFPFILVGKVFLKVLRDTFVESPTPGNVFCYGVGLGFFYFELLCGYILFARGLSITHPSIAALLPLLFGYGFLLRYWFLTEENNTDPLTYKESIAHYWKTSKMEFTTQLCLAPIGVALAVIYGHDEE